MIIIAEALALHPPETGREKTKKPHRNGAVIKSNCLYLQHLYGYFRNLQRLCIGVIIFSVSAKTPITKGVIIMMYCNAGLDLPRQFGLCMRLERERRKWSQEYFAERVGVDPRTVRRWEADGITRVDNLMVIAATFGSDWRDIFSDREDIPLFITKEKIPMIRTFCVLVMGVLFVYTRYQKGAVLLRFAARESTRAMT